MSSELYGRGTKRASNLAIEESTAMGSDVSMAYGYSCKQGESGSGQIFIKMECRELSIASSKYLTSNFTY